MFNRNGSSDTYRVKTAAKITAYSRFEPSYIVQAFYVVKSFTNAATSSCDSLRI
jgi:hypothetical protein